LTPITSVQSDSEFRTVNQEILLIFRVNRIKMNRSPQSNPLPASGETSFGALSENLGFLSAIAAGTLAFIASWLSSNQAAAFTLLILISLIGLSWRRFDGGRHPCFFFLCTLTLFQGGRLLAYFSGSAPEIFRVTLLTVYPFDVSRNVQGLVSLSISLSALCIYAPCRWNYRRVAPQLSASCDQYLPYLYCLFALSVPVQLYKNFCYYEYAKQHGGYLVVFIDHGGMAASIPLLVRAISVISLPAIVGIFVLERRKSWLCTAGALYFLIAAPILLTGSRGAIFSLILALWYLAKVKSSRPARWTAVALLATGLVVMASLIGSLRADSSESFALAGTSRFLEEQGASLDVTSVAIAYRRHFAPHIASYLIGELDLAFVPPDQTKYSPGQHFADDVSMFLNPSAYQMGFGTGSSYLAEAYVMGGLAGVALVSGLLGILLHRMHLYSRSPLGLFLVTMLLPDVLWMARGGLLDFVSVAARIALSLLLLWMGWWLYRALGRLGRVLWQGAIELPPRASTQGCPVLAGRDLS